MAAYMNVRPAGDEDFDSDDDGFNFDNAYSSSTSFNDIPHLESETKFTIGSPPMDTKDASKNQLHYKMPQRDKQGSLLVADDLRTAISKGNLDEVKKFIQEGVPVDFKLHAGWTCLMYAVSSGKADIVEYLLENKANPNFTCDLFTPLLAGCCSTALEDEILSCVEQLINHGAHINSHDRHFMTALMFAAKSGLASVVDYLIKCKCDINKQDDRGWTALCYAAAGGFTGIAKQLLDNKARTKTRCADGPVSDIAYNSGHEKLAEMIEEHENPERFRTKNNMEPSEGQEQFEKNASKGMDKYKRYGDLDLFLFGLKLGHLIPVFQQQELDFAMVMQMNDQDLEKVGINELGIRRKILKSIHEIHKKKWEPGSIRTPNSKVLSCKESIDIIENISKHISYISSTVSYVRKNMKDHSSLTSEKVDSAIVEHLSTETLESLKKVKVLHTELKQLRSHVSEVTGNRDMVPADLVEEPESQQSIFMWRVLPSLVTLTVTVASMWLKPSHLSTALITASIVGLRPPPLIAAGVASWFIYWTTQTEPLNVDWIFSRISSRFS
ncbi:ankyrin repeat, SAM and basic leucine zipper domain-containing protein 1-like isoform X2 [Anneissia japonica]|uniref:ankyrin repeat, SAM and basic leucine zipper domain-containing protein 1-like isoform X2 n=1 Tax=Anneissia japonica TaxID=1529436 RepID=UPI00142550DC|nr:ankyrin repeat, SAM and basic leucine zipper domain-containing protein 1-like isoform X2 [Anneissia japonica]